jgi:hypothetical protein
MADRTLGAALEPSFSLSWSLSCYEDIDLPSGPVHRATRESKNPDEFGNLFIVGDGLLHLRLFATDGAANQ